MFDPYLGYDPTEGTSPVSGFFGDLIQTVTRQIPGMIDPGYTAPPIGATGAQALPPQGGISPLLLIGGGLAVYFLFLRKK